MRTLLVGAMIVAACQTSAAMADEAAALALVERLGGKYVRGPALKGGIDVDFSLTSRVGNADLKALKDIKDLTKLDLTGNRVTDDGLKELTVHKKLAKLILSGTNVTDKGVADLKKVLPNVTVVR